MKYKIGDKVRITRVGSQTDPKVNDWIGKVSKVKGINPEEFSNGYMLENGFPAYEDELEPVPEFKVGDRVRVTTTANPDYTRGKVGYIREIWDKGIFFPFKVKLDNWKHNPEGWDYGYSDTEIEKVEPVFTSGVLDKIMNNSIWLDFGSVAPQPEPMPKPKATTTFALLGMDGYYYDAEFVNIGYEMFRSYLFPEGTLPTGGKVTATIIRVDNPKWLYVAPSGSHRIIDKYGRSHYIPCGWKHLWWLVEEGKPEPVK